MTLKVQTAAFNAVTKTKPAYLENVQAFYTCCVSWDDSNAKRHFKELQSPFVITGPPLKCHILTLTTPPSRPTHEKKPPCCLHGTRGLPLVAASAEPDKPRLGGVSESRPLTISQSPVAVASPLDVGPDKPWAAHHLQLSAKG